MKLGFYSFLAKKYFYRSAKILKSDGRFFRPAHYSKWRITPYNIKPLFGNIMYLPLIIKNKYM